ncbi:hypothetical protein N7468_003499 [Penicillium chermesinum]|uniref:Uncharacterized protein n=1 Tax=Penicillium chermesinum TaxID=63820 RepID=A0A9W9P6Q0_9EURO|nr:uncharacterized protein N7468_003499 [Penicillium chermesinum]KAJ5238880.1 hypothetical protein N7468_003499 [Penicillium chermesinum]
MIVPQPAKDGIGAGLRTERDDLEETMTGLEDAHTHLRDLDRPVLAVTAVIETAMITNVENIKLLHISRWARVTSGRGSRQVFKLTWFNSFLCTITNSECSKT